MEYVTELVAFERSATTASGYRNCRTRVALKVKGKDREEEKISISTHRLENWRLKVCAWGENMKEKNITTNGVRKQELTGCYHSSKEHTDTYRIYLETADGRW